MTIRYRVTVNTLILAARLSGAAVLIGLVAPLTVSAQTPRAKAAATTLGRLEGTVFDSLAKRIVAGATVWIAGTTISTAADEKGHYTLDSIPLGKQAVAFSAPAFDSAGLGTLGRAINVRAGIDSQVNLASPSLRTLWTALCKYRASNGKDSGIVYGTVHDAESKTRLVKAPTIFKWYDMNKREKRVSFAESENRAESDSTGTYFACGLPTDVAFSVRSYGNNAASGSVEYSLGERSVTRIDFTVSKELAKLENTRGTAALHGVVRDGAGAPVAGAVVTLISADTSVRTNEAGEFTLRRLPAGTQGLQVRKIGLGVANKLVDLRPGEMVEASIPMPPARTLATYNVRAAKTLTMEESDFEDRRKIGFGTVVDFDKRDFASPINALNNIPRVTLARGRNGSETVTMLNGKNSCNPTYYLNGGKVDADQMRDYPADRIRYAEVYTSSYTVPARFMTTGINACGVVLYWTKDRW
ncbi:MAG: carboxypeptidase regulatory-like domain-containing protein [Gemmatimonas sp.]